VGKTANRFRIPSARELISRTIIYCYNEIAKLRCRIFGVGISSYGRTYEEGKKIGWRDSLPALYAIIKHGCWRWNALKHAQDTDKLAAF